MSNIDTSTINKTYPVPGTNNSTQGFRDNFTSISNNLDTAANEISDLQNKVILTSALNGLTLNNDMNNTVLSNVQTVGFRASTYDLSSSLPVNPAVVVIDVSSADVHYGILAGNSSFIFGGWAPTGTESSVELIIKTNSSTLSGATISFPNTTYDSSGNVSSGMKQSIRLLQNYSSLYIGTTGIGGASVTSGSQVTIYPNSNMANVSHTNTITLPVGVVELHLKFTTIDCGTTIDVEPLNTSRVSSMVQYRTPTKTGLQGDNIGAICTDGTNLYICTGPYDGSTTIWSKTALTALT